MEAVDPCILKQHTNFKPHPIEVHRQIALTLYRLAHSVTFNTLADLFGVSISLAERVFNAVIREMVRNMYDEYVFLPRNEEEWKEKVIGFLENYGFPCAAAWDGFHIYFGIKLKNHFSFKKRYSISNMGLVSHNKRFLAATVNAPGSTHDARLLRHTSVFSDIVSGRALPDKSINLGNEYGEIPLVTIGDNAFPRYQ